MRKKYIIIVAVIVFVLGAAFYAKNVYLPRRLKAALEEFLTTHSPFKVSFSSINVGINGTLNIGGIEAKLPAGHTVFLLRRLGATLSLKDFLKKRFFISSLKLEGLEVFLRRRGKKIDVWNVISEYAAAQKALRLSSSRSFSSATADSGVSRQKAWGSKFFIYKASVPRARVHFYDDASGLQQIFDINLSAVFSLHKPAAVNFTLVSSALSLRGRAKADLEKMRVEGAGAVNMLDAAQIMRFLNYRPKYKIEKLAIKKWEYSFSLSPNGLVLDNTVSLSRLGVKGRYKFDSGGMEARGRILYEKGKKIKYEIKGRLEEGEIYKLPYFGKISRIKSEFYLSDNIFRLTSLTAVACGQPFAAELQLQGFKDPYIDLSLNSRLDISVVHRLGFLKKGVKLGGPALLKAELKGRIKEISFSQLKAEVEMKGDETYFPPAGLKQIEGKIFLQDGGVAWEKLRFVFRGVKFKSRGRIDSLASIRPVFSLASDYFDLDASFSWDKKNRIIQDIRVKGSAGKRTSFNLQGSFNTASGRLKAKGLANIALPDLLRQGKTAEFLKPQGEAEVQFAGEGKLKDINSFSLQAEIKSKRAVLHNLKFDNLQALAELKEGEVVISPLEADFYQGNLQLRLKYGLKVHSFLANFKVVEAEAGRLAVDLGKKPDDYGGRLSLDIDAAGADLRNRNSWRAEGRAEIKDGKIWKLDLFRGIEKLLPLKGRQEIVFRDGWANFSLQKGVVSLEGLSLLSTFLEIKSKGTISLEGNLNLLVFLNISPPLIRDAPALNKIASFLLDNGFVTIEVKGSLKNPTYRLVPFFIKANPLKKMKGFIGDIFNVLGE